MTPEQAQRELVRIKRSFMTAQEPDFLGFETVNEAIVDMMPRLSYEWADILWKELNALGDAINSRKNTLGSKLSDMAPKRRAMKGYGHLRSHKRGQRIEKSV
jgi:hypothetical protein